MRRYGITCTKAWGLLLNLHIKDVNLMHNDYYFFHLLLAFTPAIMVWLAMSTIQTFLSLFDHLIFSLPVPMIQLWYMWVDEEAGTFGPCTHKRPDNNLLATRWRLPCPIRKQMGIKYITDISSSDQSTQICSRSVAAHLSCSTDSEFS